MSERVGFVLEVKPERIEEYVAEHRQVWAEMIEALQSAGIRNYTIFRDGSRVFGYFETDDRAETERFLAAHPANVRWQDHMASLLVERVDNSGPAPLEEIFRLE